MQCNISTFDLRYFYLSIYLWVYSPLLDLGCFSVSRSSYTVGRTPWTGDQPVSRPLPAHRAALTQNKLHRYPCHEWGSNPRSQCLSGRHCGRQLHYEQCGILFAAYEHVQKFKRRKVSLSSSCIRLEDAT
jgi:hypothetical protein